MTAVVTTRKSVMYMVTPKRPRFNAMFYGDPGSGKTTLAATAQDSPQMADVMFYNIEGGLLSIAHRGDIRAIDIGDCAKLDREYWKLKRREAEYETIKTVVIDSGTELQTINLQEIVVAAIEVEKTKERNESKRKRTLDAIWQDDYGKSTSYLRRIFRQFKNLPINFIVTALPKYTYPKVEGRSEAAASAMGVDPLVVLPSMTQKVSESLMGYMDFVWYTFYDQDEGLYKVLTKSTGPYRAKTRGPHFQKKVGDVIVSPSLADIYQTFVDVESAGAATNARRAARAKRSSTSKE